MKLYSFLSVLALSVWGVHQAWAAEALTEAIEHQAKSNEAAASAQKNIDALNEQSRRLSDEYRDALRRTEALNAYNAHLRQLVASQALETQSLEKQQADIQATRRDIVPLMLRMVDALDHFVQRDRPFLQDERSQRVAELKAMMTQAELNDAEKFRAVLDAYRTENDYGNTIETYRGDLKEGAGSRTVDFLRVGRVALLYQSLDGREIGAWNNRSRRWQTLPAEYRDAVRQGLAVARKDIPPELFPIAVELPEAGQ